jgi:virginiamycin B lyase
MKTIQASASLLGVLLVMLIIACGGSSSSPGGDTKPSGDAPAPATSDGQSTERGPDVAPTATPRAASVQAYAVPKGSRPHDVAPAADGGVWYTAQGSGKLGWLDPKTGDVKEIPLGQGSAPHGVMVGPDGAAWITDSGLNAMVRVDPKTSEVKVHTLPGRRVNLNTAAFDKKGQVWFTGQGGVYGRLNPQTGEMQVFDSPKGPGPYGITVTPNGDVYYASLAGSFVGKIDVNTGQTTVLTPPTPNQGARRVWSDSKGRVWVAEWNVGKAGMYDPATNAWKEWQLPGSKAQPYAVYVDDKDKVWFSDFAGDDAIVKFDPETEKFESFALPHKDGNVRQLLGRPGEVWGAESGSDQIVVVRN